MTQCPEPDGQYSTDFGIHQHCRSCNLREDCRKDHDIQARVLKDNLKGWPRFLTIPAPLYGIRELNAYQREIIALVLFRHQGNHHRGYDKNVDIGNALGIKPQYAGRLVSDLVTKGFLQRDCVHRKTRKWESKRALSPTVRTLRVVNSAREEKDKLRSI